MLEVAMTTQRSGSTTFSQKAASNSRMAAAREMTTGSAHELSAREHVSWNGSCNNKVCKVFM